MTEADLLACTDPRKMLEYLRGKVGDRKLRLLAVAWCDQITHQTITDRDRVAIREGERYADGLSGESERFKAWDAIQLSKEAAVRSEDFDRAAWLMCLQRPLAKEMDADDLIGLARSVSRPGAWVHIRDIIGSLFRPSAPLCTDVLAWNGGTVRRIAGGIYEDRAFGRLPILADALLDAGCEDEELLAHCRSEGPHVRGCWAVDLILGKT